MKKKFNKFKLNNKGFNKIELIIIIAILGIIIITGTIIASGIKPRQKKDNGIVLISYDANGGKGEMSNSKCKKNAECIIKNNSFNKQGYKFIGWATSAEEETPTYKINDNYIAKSDIKLYAVWKVKEVTISYNANGGTGEMEKTIYKYDGSRIKISENKFEKQGYTFSGWQIYNPTLDKWYGCLDENVLCDETEKNSTLGWHKREEIKTYYNNQLDWDTKNSEYDIIYYAKWGENTYKITYELDGGVVEKETPISGTTGSIVTINAPTKEGYIFNGWTITGTDAKIENNQLTIGTSDITLKANWKEFEQDKKVYLYNVGKDNTELTGGWIASKKLNRSQSASQSGKVTINSDNMVASVKYVAKKAQAVGFIHAKNKIDVTDYNKLYIRCSFETNHSSVTTTFGLFKKDAVPNFSGLATQQLKKTTSDTLYTIDVSNITGSYYLGFYIGHRNNPAAASVKINEIYLSK